MTPKKQKYDLIDNPFEYIGYPVKIGSTGMIGFIAIAVIFNGFCITTYDPIFYVHTLNNNDLIKVSAENIEIYTGRILLIEKCKNKIDQNLLSHIDKQYFT